MILPKLSQGGGANFLNVLHNICPQLPVTTYSSLSVS